jgi:FtsP/CotA-like multicopper oxidase with cupredoxin domain
MARRESVLFLFVLALVLAAALPVSAQSFRVQCPNSTITHPAATNNSEPAYSGPTQYAPGSNGYLVPSSTTVNGAIKCQQISGGDGQATMADGTQTYMFSFGPLSGLADIAAGLPGTQYPDIFNTVYTGTTIGSGSAAMTQPMLLRGDPATTDGVTGGASGAANPLAFTYNGAVGLMPDLDAIADGKCTAPCLDGHVDPHQIIDVGVLNGNIPAPLMAFDEDDEFFLTLTNVGMIMRPDLFEQHTVHFHGYPNASSFYDGVPDASVAINIGGSFTYYYLAPDAGTYFWHCHITPPEHLQMGMVGQLHVRPRQDRVPPGASLFAALGLQNGLNCSGTTCTPLPPGTADLRTVCNPTADILCSATMPAINTGATQGTDKLGLSQKYTYNDGDASTAYDVEYPIQMHGFDPNFHFVGMTFNPEMFVDMKDKYFLLNGRSYPDTVTPGPQATTVTDGNTHYSQPLPALINIPVGGRALLRIVNLSVSEYHTLASLGVPMKEVGFNAKLLRDQAGNNTEFYTNSITLGGGESLDVILDASDTMRYPAGSVFYLYSPQLDHLSNDAENFGGMMTEVHICNSVSGTTFGNICN